MPTTAHRSPPLARDRIRRAARDHGQSMVEFTLVFPILLLLLLTVADFGRYFMTGIQIESAARDAAERAAAEYLRSAQPLDPAAYDSVHAYAWQLVCNEVGGLPNAVPPPAPGQQCGNVATIVCVHDGADPGCASLYNQGSLDTSKCPSFASAATNTQTGGSETSKYVEVRVCYRFSTLLPITVPFVGGNLSPLSGDFYIDRSRTFTIADY